VPLRALACLFALAGWSAILLPGPAQGSVVPSDTISLLNGAEYFERYCTECHGWDPSEQYESLYGEDPIDEPDPLFASEQPAAPENILPAQKPIDDWPEWAGPPPEEDSVDPEVRDEVLSDLVSAIDEVYGEDTQSDNWNLIDEDPEFSDASDVDAIEESFGDALEEEEGPERMPGATDLTDPGSYLLGTTEADLYYHIANGTGAGMPGFLSQLGSEEAVWDVVNYIRSLWGEDWVD
tara:strand:- start:4044 stop:4754 length:711 start_codon:yes stop_codon:yes gene_type:complete